MLVDCQERIEYGRDQNCPACMRFHRLLVFRWIRLVRLPLTVLAYFTYRVAECAVPTCRFTKLPGQLAQYVFVLRDLTTSVGNLMREQFWKCEVLEQGDAIGK